MSTSIKSIVLIIPFLFLSFLLKSQDEFCDRAYLALPPNILTDIDAVERLTAEILYWEDRGHSTEPIAMRAHAVVIRTHIYYNRLNNNSDPFQMHYEGPVIIENLPNDIEKTAFRIIQQAVSSTRGIVMTYNLSPIRAFYFAQCNGTTTLDANNGIWANCQHGSAGNEDFSYAVARSCDTPHGPSTASDACEGYHGPGVGMCETGAFEYSFHNDMRWCEILERYYTNISFHTVTAPIPYFVDNSDLQPFCGAVGINQTNNSVTISNVQLSNLGTAGAYNFDVFYILKGTSNNFILGSQTVSAVEAESTITVPSTFFDSSTIPNGSYTLEVRAAHEPNESDYTNNSCETTTSYTISSTQASCTDGIQNQGELGIDCGGPCIACAPQTNLKSQACVTPIVNEDQLTVLYEITNFGAQASGNFYIGFYAYKSGTSNPIPLNDLTTFHTSIPGNTSQTFNLTVDLQTVMNNANQTEGDYRIGMVLDEYFQVAESDENDNFCVNNTYFSYSSINIKNGPSCLVGQVSGEYLNLYHTFINEGNADSGIFSYQFMIRDIPNDLYYLLGPNYDVFNVPANSSANQSASFHLDTEMSKYGLPAGEYGLAIIADYNDILDETDEGDNFCLSSSTFIYSGGCNMQDGFLQGSYSGTFDFNAPNYLIAPNVNNECKILSGSTVHITAGNYVDLNPGFIAYAGSTFSASIEDCTDVNNLVYVEEENQDQLQVEKTKEASNSNSQPTTKTVVDPTESRINTPKTHLNITPNPFSDETTISFTVEVEDNYVLVLSTLDGQTAKILKENQVIKEGTYQHLLNSENLESGTYIVTLTSSTQSLSKKLFFMK